MLLDAGPMEIQVEPVDESSIAQAEQDAVDAEWLAESLTEKVRNGEDVDPAELTNAEQLGRFARLRVEAARRKVERAKTAARLADCKSLCDEIESYSTGTGQRFAELLASAEDAIRAFVTAVDERNQHIKTWRQRMHNLQIPEHVNPVVPPKEHGRLGWIGFGGHVDGHVIGGQRRLAPTSPEQWLNSMLCLITMDLPVKHLQSTVPGGSPVREALYEKLAHIDAPAVGASTDLVHFHGENGSVSSYDPDRVPSAEDIKRLKLTRISRKEAWGA